MQEDKIQLNLSWSTPKKGATQSVLKTQAPIYAALFVGGIIIGVLLSTMWNSYHRIEASKVMLR
jgi:cation transporter-like permease